MTTRALIGVHRLNELEDIVRELAEVGPRPHDQNWTGACDFCEARDDDGRPIVDLALHHDRCIWRRAKEVTRA